MYKVFLPGEALIDIFENKNKIEAKVGGAPLNVAAAISKFTVPTFFAGSIGNDDHGKVILKKMQELKLSSDCVFLDEKKTTIAKIRLDKNGERSFSFVRGADENLQMSQIDKKIINSCKILAMVSATAFLGGEIYKTYLKLIAHSKDKIIFFDPNYRENLYSNDINDFVKKSQKLIRNSHIVKMSEEEFKIIFGSSICMPIIKQILTWGPKVILVTRGKKGTEIFTQDQKKLIPSISVAQKDSTGAGDAFFGFFIGYISFYEYNLEEIVQNIEIIVQQANVAGALTVTKIGALDSIPSRNEVIARCKGRKWS